MKPELLQILQHACGADKYGEGGGTRNHFCAGAADEPLCRELVELGYMVQHETTKWLPYFNCSTTKAGRDAMREASPRPAILSRSQKRYREFLKADTGDTFIQWLRDQTAYRFAADGRQEG